MELFYLLCTKITRKQGNADFHLLKIFFRQDPTLGDWKRRVRFCKYLITGIYKCILSFLISIKSWISVSIRILQMIEKGLIMEWTNHFQLKPFHCMHKLDGKVKTTQGRAKLTLKNFLGAFLLLGFGYCLSLAVFLFERFLTTSNRYTN